MSLGIARAVALFVLAVQPAQGRRQSAAADAVAQAGVEWRIPFLQSKKKPSVLNQDITNFAKETVATKANYVRIKHQKPCSKSERKGLPMRFKVGKSAAGHALPDFADVASSWCNAKFVAPKLRVPRKLRGLFWMKDLWLQDAAVCMSLMEWDKKKNRGTINVWSHFVYRETQGGGEPLILKFARKTNARYYMQFDKKLSKATITSNTWKAYQRLWTLNMTERKTATSGIQSIAAGDIYFRPSRVGIGPFSTTIDYWLIRIVDGHNNIRQRAYEEMIKVEQNRTLMRYRTCGKKPPKK